jgi:DNA-binding response OmpR family regulator
MGTWEAENFGAFKNLIFSAPNDNVPMGQKNMKTIVIADKDAIARELVSLAFPDQMGYRAVAVSNGIDAILKAKDIKPDIVLVDTSLRYKNGYDVSREIKGDPTLEGTPVILLISSLGVFDEVKAAESYADDFIIKPFSSEEITKKVESLIARHEREKEEPAFNSFFGGVSKTEGDLEFEEFNESISRSRDSLGNKSLEIIFQTIAKNLESGCEIAKESGRGLKRKVARLGELITLYEIPKAAAYLKAPLFIRRVNLKESGREFKRKVARLGELITLYEIPKAAAYLKAPLFIRRVNLKEPAREFKRKVARLGELITLYEMPKAAAYLKAPLFIRRVNLILLLVLAIVLPIIILAIFTHEREKTVASSSNILASLDGLREVKLTGENTQSQEKKEAQVQEVPLKTGIRVSSRQRIRNTSKMRISERRKHRTQSQAVVAYERKKELEKQLRATFLLGD